jgi:hypothetical protein
MLVVQAPRTFGLPCPWAPLQSMTAAASRRFPSPSFASGVFAGQSHRFARDGVLRFRFRSTPPKARGRVPVVERGNPIAGRAGMLEAKGACAVSGGGRGRRSSLCAVTSDGAARERFAASFTGPRAEARAGASSTRRARPKPCSRRRSCPFGGSRPKQRAPLRAPRGGGGRSDPPRRVFTHIVTRGCLPPTGHPGGPQAQDTQRGYGDVSHGVRFLSAYEPRRSLCRFASPAPSALGVSHSLSGLSPPGPRGSVSRHIRP